MNAYASFRNDSFLQEWRKIKSHSDLTQSTAESTVTRGLSYKGSTIVYYDSRAVPDLKIPHITILEL